MFDFLRGGTWREKAKRKGTYVKEGRATALSIPRKSRQVKRRLFLLACKRNPLTSTIHTWRDVN